MNPSCNPRFVPKKGCESHIGLGSFNFPCGGLGDQDFHTVLVWSFEANDG